MGKKRRHRRMTWPRYFQAMLKMRDRALDAAFEAAKEKSASHNDLIKAGQVKEATYVTKGALYAAFGILVSLIIAGVAVAGLFLRH